MFQVGRGAAGRISETVTFFLRLMLFSDSLLLKQAEPPSLVTEMMAFIFVLSRGANQGGLYVLWRTYGREE